MKDYFDTEIKSHNDALGVALVSKGSAITMEDTNFIHDAFREGDIAGINTALELAEITREITADIDYFISALKEIKKKHEERI